MIELYVDLLTKKIIGYNTILPSQPRKDLILVDDSYISLINNSIKSKKIFTL